MNNKKLTDNEIIKALECCGRESCFGCPYRGKCHQGNPMITDALDLITRQQTEIERLRKEVNLVSIQFQDLQERYEEAQTENENLKVENQSLRSAANSLKMHYEEAQTKIESLKIFRGYAEKRASDYKTMRDKYLNAKSEAVKECLAKVKNYTKTHCNPYGKPDFDYDTSIKILNFINKLAKEMVGDYNA